MLFPKIINLKKVSFPLLLDPASVQAVAMGARRRGARIVQQAEVPVNVAGGPPASRGPRLKNPMPAGSRITMRTYTRIYRIEKKTTVEREPNSPFHTSSYQPEGSHDGVLRHLLLRRRARAGGGARRRGGGEQIILLDLQH